jgi:hypothetical protein
MYEIFFQETQEPNLPEFLQGLEIQTGENDLFIVSDLTEEQMEVVNQLVDAVQLGGVRPSKPSK